MWHALLKSFVWTYFIAVLDGATLGKPRIVYPRLLEARSSNNSVSLFINEEITLNLERADIFPEMFVLQYPEGKGEVNEYINGADLNNLVYDDTDQMSAVSIERDDGLYVNGIIQNTYRITPMYNMERSETGIFAHELVKVKEPHSPLHGDLPAVVYPEVMVLADIEIKKSVGRSLDLVLYVGLLMASANLRFASLKHPSLKLRLCSVKTMTQTQKANIYEFIYAGGQKYLDINATIFNLASEVEDASYNNYDFVILLTQFKVAIRRNNVLDTHVQGYAFVGAPCSKNKVAVIEDSDLGLVGASTFAHETAHMLGCPHDGQGSPLSVPGSPGATRCRESDGYLMGDLYRNLEDKRKYRLSSCCEESIVYVLGLTSSECLKKTNHPKYITTSQLPGSVITPNQTCKQYLKQLNLENGYYDKEQRGLKECKLNCRTPLDGNRSYSFADTSALDGTSCDRLKVCKSGSCVKKTN